MLHQVSGNASSLRQPARFSFLKSIIDILPSLMDWAMRILGLCCVFAKTVTAHHVVRFQGHFLCFWLGDCSLRVRTVVPLYFIHTDLYLHAPQCSTFILHTFCRCETFTLSSHKAFSGQVCAHSTHCLVLLIYSFPLHCQLTVLLYFCFPTALGLWIFCNLMYNHTMAVVVPPGYPSKAV